MRRRRGGGGEGGGGGFVQRKTCFVLASRSSAGALSKLSASNHVPSLLRHGPHISEVYIYTLLRGPFSENRTRRKVHGALCMELPLNKARSRTHSRARARAFSLYLNLKIRSADAREAPTDVQAAPYRRQGVDGTSCTAHYCLPDALPPSHDVVARRRRAITTAGRYREFAACQRGGGRVGATEIKRDGGRRERERRAKACESQRERESKREETERDSLGMVVGC